MEYVIIFLGGFVVGGIILYPLGFFRGLKEGRAVSDAFRSSYTTGRPDDDE